MLIIYTDYWIHSLSFVFHSSPLRPRTTPPRDSTASKVLPSYAGEIARIAGAIRRVAKDDANEDSAV